VAAVAASNAQKYPNDQIIAGDIPDIRLRLLFREAGMSVRIPVITAAVVVAGTALLAACGSATTSASSPAAPAASSPAPSSSSAGHAPPPVVAPMIIAVRLGTTFSPDTLRLAAGMKFQLIVSQSVDPSGPSFPAHCASGTSYAANDGMLSVTCPATGGYLFTAERAGTTVLSATVRPHCSAGEMCPQWVKEAALTITVT
jgi:hypothetical protein